MPEMLDFKSRDLGLKSNSISYELCDLKQVTLLIMGQFLRLYNCKYIIYIAIVKDRKESIFKASSVVLSRIGLQTVQLLMWIIKSRLEPTKIS